MCMWNITLVVNLNVYLSVCPNSVANDDQFASNVPDTTHPYMENMEGVAPGEGVALEGVTQTTSTEDHTDSSRSGYHENISSPAVTMEVGIRYLSQLRRSPFPINGIYALHHHSATNHFRRYADIKHRGTICIMTIAPCPLHC